MQRMITQKGKEKDEVIQNSEILSKRLEILTTKQIEEVKKYEDEIEKYQKLLNSKDSSLSQTVKYLESQVSLLNAKNHALTTDLSQTIIKLEDVKSQLAGKENSSKDLKEAYDRLQDSYNQLNSSIKHSSSEKNSLIAELQVEIVKQKEKIKEMEIQHDREIEKIMAEVDQIVLSGVTKERELLRIERDTEIAKVDQALKQEREKKLETEKEVHDLQIKNISLARDLGEMREAIVAANQRTTGYETLSTRNRLLEKEILEKGAKIDQINKTLDEFQKIIEREQQTHNAAMNKLTHQRDKAEKELEISRQELAKLQNGLHQTDFGTKKNEENLKSRILELEASLKSREQDEVHWQGKLREVHQRLQQKDEEVTEAYHHTNKLKQDIEINSRIFEDQKLTIERLNKKIEELQIQATLARRSQVDLGGDTYSQQKEIEELQGRFREALTQLGHVKVSASRLEAEMDTIRRENIRLKKVLYSDSSREQSRMEFIRKDSIEQLASQEGRSRAESMQQASTDIRVALDKAFARVEQLQQELLECKTDLHTVVRQRNEKEKLADHYQQQLKALSEELSAKNVEAMNLKDKVLRLELDFHKSRKTAETPKEEHIFELASSDRSSKELVSLGLALRSKEQALEEAELVIKALQSQVDRAVDDKNRLLMLSSNSGEELARSRKKITELEGMVDSLRADYGECKAQLSALKVKLLNIESKSSVQNINYEEILKERESELFYRDQMIEQLTKDCDHLLAKMKNEENVLVGSDAQVENLLLENRILQKELIDIAHNEQRLREEIDSLREQHTKVRAYNGDSGSFDSIMQANALKERQLQMKIGTLEQRVADLQEELHETKGVQRREVVYREEAERFRLMYNDSQRELIKLKEELDQRAYEGSPYRLKGQKASYPSPLRHARESPSPENPKSRNESRISERNRSHLNSSAENYRLMNDSRHSDN